MSDEVERLLENIRIHHIRKPRVEPLVPRTMTQELLNHELLDHVDRMRYAEAQKRGFADGLIFAGILAMFAVGFALLITSSS